MTRYEFLSVVVGVLGVAVNLILFVVFFLQLRALRQQLNVTERLGASSEERARRNATVEFYVSTNDRRRDFVALARSKELGSPAEVIKAARVDGLLRAELINFLNYYEFLAVGVNMGTYDFETIKRLAAGRIRAIVHDYHDYFVWARAEAGRAGLYVEVERLAEAFDATETPST